MSTVRFDTFELDLLTAELRCDGSPVALERQPAVTLGGCQFGGFRVEQAFARWSGPMSLVVFRVQWPRRAAARPTPTWHDSLEWLAPKVPATFP